MNTNNKAFEDSPSDKGLSIILKREANIILAKLDENSDEYEDKLRLFEETLSVVKTIEYNEPQNANEINFILNTINCIWNTGILSPLTLREEEFLDFKDSFGCFVNKRYRHIFKFNGDVYNKMAFNRYVRAEYSHTYGKELVPNCRLQKGNNAVYISKGGIITGEYFEECIIRPETVNKHCFTIQSIVNIPVSVIYFKDKNDNDRLIYVVDHREPKLKVLKEFYDVKFKNDSYIKSMKFNIRSYLKLNQLNK